MDPLPPQPLREVLAFVNEIAEIVHAIVDLHCGAPNRNLGNAFLAVWQIQRAEKIKDTDAPSLVHAAAESGRM